MIRRPPRSTLFPTRRSSDLFGCRAVAITAREILGPREHAWSAVLYDSATRAVVRSDRKSTRLNSSHSQISYAVFCLKKKKKNTKVNVNEDHKDVQNMHEYTE